MPFNRRVISRQHLWLEPRSEDWLFMDNRSGNGTLIHLNSSVTLILEANRWHTIITHTTGKSERGSDKGPSYCTTWTLRLAT